MAVDKHAVNEIVLFIRNDSQLYRQQWTPIVLNYAKRKVKGTFNKQLAVKGVVNLVNTGIQKYKREFGLQGAAEYGLSRVSMETKQAAAKELLGFMMEEINETAKDLKKLQAAKEKAKKAPKKRK